MGYPEKDLIGLKAHLAVTVTLTEEQCEAIEEFAVFQHLYSMCGCTLVPHMSGDAHPDLEAPNRLWLSGEWITRTAVVTKENAWRWEACIRPALVESPSLESAVQQAIADLKALYNSVILRCSEAAEKQDTEELVAGLADEWSLDIRDGPLYPEDDEGKVSAATMMKAHSPQLGMTMMRSADQQTVTQATLNHPNLPKLQLRGLFKPTSQETDGRIVAIDHMRAKIAKYLGGPSDEPAESGAEPTFTARLAAQKRGESATRTPTTENTPAEDNHLVPPHTPLWFYLMAADSKLTKQLSGHQIWNVFAKAGSSS